MPIATAFILSVTFHHIMRWKNLTRRFRYYLQYFPLTINAFIIGVAFWIIIRIITPEPLGKGEEVSSFRPLILLMGKAALWFIAALILFSLLSCMLCWLYFLWLQRKGRGQFIFSVKPAEKNKGLVLEVFLEKARRPFLGFIKGRLFYDQYRISDNFVLASNKRKERQFWREGITGKNVFELPDIKEYTIEGGFVYFVDMLQLFSLPVRQKINGRFYRLPDNIGSTTKEVQPRKTEQTDIRIDQMRKVQGEYLNYKDFESGDDVRRVVWKVYAKSRELVVRIPEVHEPYASHIYFYASFHSTFPGGRQSGLFGAEMLNFYKNRVWTAYEVLSRKDWELRYIADQNLNIAETTTKDEWVQRTISQSQWQDSSPITGYFKPAHGSVLCISSFNDPEELVDLLSSCSPDTVIYYIKLSHTFKHFLPWNWLKRIFMYAPEDRLKKIRSRWLFSPLRIQILKREKAIEAILNNSNVTVGQL